MTSQQGFSTDLGKTERRQDRASHCSINTYQKRLSDMRASQSGAAPSNLWLDMKAHHWDKYAETDKGH